jgi:hypothetical protein
MEEIPALNILPLGREHPFWALAECQEIANAAEQLRWREENVRCQKTTGGHAEGHEKSDGPASDGCGAS